jgi:hypothetical protein
VITLALDIATGQMSSPDPLQPLDASGVPALAPPTPASPSGNEQGGVMPTTAMNLEQQRQGEADCAAAMQTGMDARNAMLGHYEGQVLPLGGMYGDLMHFPPNALDPGAGVGNTLPTAGFYDPPRGYGGAEGAPGYIGNEPPAGYQGEAQ